MLSLSVKEAFANRKHNVNGRWSTGNVSADGGNFSLAQDRVWRQGVCPVAVSPKFVLPRASRIFTIGSCFARNIERQLIARDMQVLSRLEVDPAFLKSDPADPAGFLNKFTAASILSELEFVTNRRSSADSIYQDSNGLHWNSLIRLAKPLALDRAKALRGMVDTMYSRLREADAVIITLGLIESWVDTDTGLGINGPPPPNVASQSAGRFRMIQTGVAENTDAIKAIVTQLREITPNAKVVFTVSPVPLGSTFTANDIVVANCLSKSVLRCAISEALLDPNVDYFPSYEMALWGNPPDVWNKDRLHVTERAVSEITSYFLTQFITD